jgi:hypothetical protein
VKLFRRVDQAHTTDWLEHFAKGKPFRKRSHPPLWSLSTFLPSSKDDCWLSVWGINGDVKLDHIVAAESYVSSTTSASFLGVEFELIEAAHLKIRKSLGKTVVDRVNSLHFEVQIDTPEKLFRIVRLFSAGDFKKVEKRSADVARTFSTRNSWPNYHSIATQGDNVRSLHKMISAKEVKLFGSDSIP